MKISFSLVVGALFVSACARAESKEAESRPVVVTGSSTIAPVLGEIAKKYESLHPRVRIDVQAGGSSRGITDARSGLAAIGMVSRSLAPEEKDLSVYALAKDGVCVIVHADNPIASLSVKTSSRSIRERFAIGTPSAEPMRRSRWSTRRKVARRSSCFCTITS